MATAFDLMAAEGWGRERERFVPRGCATVKIKERGGGPFLTPSSHRHRYLQIKHGRLSKQLRDSQC